MPQLPSSDEQLIQLFHRLRDLDEEVGEVFFSNEALLSPVIPNKFMFHQDSYNQVRLFFLDWYNYDGVSITYKIRTLNHNEIQSLITNFLNVISCF